MIHLVSSVAYQMQTWDNFKSPVLRQNINNYCISQHLVETDWRCEVYSNSSFPPERISTRPKVRSGFTRPLKIQLVFCKLEKKT